MKLKQLVSKIGIMTLLAMMTVTPIMADTNMARSKVQVSVDHDEKEDILIEVDMPNRTVSVLDVAKVVFANNTLQMDYNPALTRDKMKQLSPELQLADIVEYEGEEPNSRKPLTVHKDTSSTYAGQLQYLLDNNMISRDTYFMYDAEGIYASQRRLPNPQGRNITPKLEDNNNNHAYYDENQIVAKTDFLVQLMKTNEVIPSKPIIVQTPYKRVSEKLQEEMVKYEPLETSPYTSYMGELGIDPNAHDVVINHETFKQTEVLVTSDVVEPYLAKALSLNIIDTSELGGVEGSQLSTTYANSKLIDGWKSPLIPARQFYKEINLSPKLFGEGIIYQMEQYNQFINNGGKTSLNVNCTDAGIVSVWGESYTYNVKKCNMATPYSTTATEIVKRPSVVQVRNGFKTYDINGSKDKGYQYFKDEEMTVAEAYKMTYDFLMSIGYEPTVLNPEYITSMYSLNLTSFTEEERKATEYLISVGIVNGDDKDLSKATSTHLTNKQMVDLVYRVHNKDARYTLVGELSETDRDMAQRGFSKANVTVSDAPSSQLEMYFKNSETGQTYYDTQIDDRIKNPYQYDMIYIRIPKYITDKVFKPDGTIDGYFKLVTDDNNRIPIDPINDRALNGGIEGLEHDTSQKWDTETLYDPSGTFVYKDKDGNMWCRYFVHKDLSNKVMLTSFTSSGTVTYKGITGEGVYFIEEGKSSGDMTKVSLKDAENHPVTSRLYKLLVEFDLRTRTMMQSQQRASLTTDQPTERQLLWTQTSYMAPTVQNATKVTAVFGPISETAMEAVTYKGKPMFKRVDNPANNVGKKGWDFADDLPMDDAIREGYDFNYVEGLGFEIYYTANSQNEIGALVERSNISIGANSSSNDAPTMGYAKILANGTDLVLISEKELSYFGIERADDGKGGKSDKSLKNPKTGQRAFLDTDLNLTLIGNNITQYPEDHMMVYSVGDELFYNLNILMELLNDSSTVYSRAGKNIIVNTGAQNDATTEKFVLTDVKDVLLGGAEDAPVIDRTYVLKDGTNNYYMNLSALTGSASNFLYYKNRDVVNNFDSLIVYYPAVETGEVQHTPVNEESSGSIYTNNGVITNLQQANAGIPSQYADSGNVNSAKQILFDKLFGMGKDKGSQVLYGAYNVDVYILNTSPTAGSHKEAVNRFMSFITEGKQDVYNMFLGHTKYNADELGINKITTNTNYDNGQVTLSYLPVATSRGQQENFLAHTHTGNLYYKITSQGKPNHVILQDIVKQRFYYNTKDGVISLRRKEYFENTPENCIPLEVYGKPKSRDFGALEETTNGIVQYNFPNQDHKLTLPSTDLNTGDANIRIPISEEGVTDYGLATNVELPFKSVNAETLKNFSESNKDVFAVDFFNMIVSDFTTGTPNSYPAKSAMGDIDNNVTVSVGYANDLSAESKLKFVTGTWAGMNGNSSSFYVPEIHENCEHEAHYVLTAGQDLLGKTPTKDKVKFYLHELSPTGINALEGRYVTTKTYEIKKYKDLPKDLRELIEEDEDANPQLPVHYKPSLAIPAGTTLVDTEGNLIYKPNADIREPLNYSVDIINNILARQQDLKDLSGVTLLAEANGYSLIEVGNRYMIKLSRPQEVAQSSSEKLQWVPCLLIPQTTTDGSYPVYTDKTLNEAFLMETALSDLSSITLPTQNGIKEVTVLEILGPGQFRLPFLGEIEDAKKIHDSQFAGTSRNPLMLNALNSFFVMDQNSATTVDGIQKYNPIAIKSKVSAGEIKWSNAKKATVAMVVYMPPTVQIEQKTGASDAYSTYKAIAYWDINAFNVDPNNGVVNILNEHDTDAEDIQGILDNIRKTGLDGTYYVKFSMSQFVKFLYDLGVNLMLRGIPILISFLWLFITVLTVVFWFPKTKEWGSDINRKYGRNVIGKITFHIVDVNEENPNLGKFLLASAALWGLIALLWDGYILRFIITIFVGDSGLITTLIDIFKSLLG